eukprot:5772162-Amphidinium_carterae.1
MQYQAATLRLQCECKYLHLKYLTEVKHEHRTDDCKASSTGGYDKCRVSMQRQHTGISAHSKVHRTQTCKKLTSP